eukprot:576784-Rhodomonas_salina.1
MAMSEAGRYSGSSRTMGSRSGLPATRRKWSSLLGAALNRTTPPLGSITHVLPCPTAAHLSNQTLTRVATKLPPASQRVRLFVNRAPRQPNVSNSKPASSLDTA